MARYPCILLVLLLACLTQSPSVSAQTPACLAHCERTIKVHRAQASHLVGPKHTELITRAQADEADHCGCK